MVGQPCADEDLGSVAELIRLAVIFRDRASLSESLLGGLLRAACLACPGERRRDDTDATRPVFVEEPGQFE